MWRIRDRATFERLRASSTRRRHGVVSVTRAPADVPVPQVAFAIARRVGTAVTRNRIRRRLRETIRTADLAPGAYLVSVSPHAAAVPAEQLRDDLLAAISALPAAEDPR